MTTPKEHEVTGCRGCPFDYDIGYDCRHPDKPIDRDIDFLWPGPPDWCPLREGPITVRLRK